QLLFTELKEVIIVAANSTRWLANAMYFQRSQVVGCSREQLRLHLLRDFQLALQTLLFFLLEQQPLDRCRHGIERFLQCRQLIVGLNSDAMVEITAIYTLCRLVEIGD